MTVCDDEIDPVIPIRVVLGATVNLDDIVQYKDFKARQAQVLRQYEDGQSNLERTEHVKDVESKLRAANSEVQALKKELNRARASEKSLKTKLENSTATEKELKNEKTKTQKLIAEIKQLESKCKQASDNGHDATTQRKVADAFRREIEELKRENAELREEVDRANKRQRTTESGEYRAISTPATAGFDVSHFENLKVKSISFSATY